MNPEKIPRPNGSSNSSTPLESQESKEEGEFLKQDLPKEESEEGTTTLSSGTKVIWNKPHNYRRWITIGVLLILVVFLIWKWNEVNTQDAKEQLLIVGGCDECINVTEPAQSLGFEVVHMPIEEAGELIDRYNLTSSPAIIIFTDEQLPFQAERVHDAYVVQNLPPYIDLQTGELRGALQLLVVEDDCKECFDADLLVSRLTQAFPLQQVDYVRATLQIIQQYDLKSLPSFVITGEVELYPVQNIGEVRNDAIIIKSQPPFKDIATGEVKGIVDVTFITDPSCENCSIEPLRILTSQLQITFGEETILEKNNAQELITRYDLERLPAVIYSEQLQYYPGVQESWGEVGSIESDGSFVFRAYDLFPMESVEINTQ